MRRAGAPRLPDPAPFVEHLRGRAAEYFPELADGSIQVHLSRTDARSAGTHFHFTLTAGGPRRRVLVKVRCPARGGSQLPISDSPVPAWLPDPSTVATREFRALSGIQARFAGLDERRFGTVRPLDLLTEHQAVLMEIVEQPSLSALFLRSSYLRSEALSATLQVAFHNAGAWLRHYQLCPAAEDATDRRPTRADFIQLVDQLTEHLGGHLGDRRFCGEVASAAKALAEASLPERLPLGSGHGDFAMRNLLVGPGGRVTVVDTLAAWAMPIYEDIGALLHSLRCNRLQVLTRRAAVPRHRIASYEQAFLDGYFGAQPIPDGAVRLYEVQATLEKWSSLVAFRARSPSWGSHLVRSARLGIISSFFRETLRDKLRLRSAAPKAAAPLVSAS